MTARSWHLVSYDVRDDRRLRRTARLLEGYGERVQYSVFRCRLTRKGLERMRWELARVMEAEDSLLIIPICAGCSRGIHESMDRAWRAEPPTYRVV